MIDDLGFSWGMTTNGTLLSAETVKYFTAHHMYSAGLSIDGPTAEIHDALRGRRGAFHDVLAGLDCLSEHGNLKDLMVTSVVNHQTVQELDAFWEVISALPIDTWRILNIEPMGSALGQKDLLFTKEDFGLLFRFIYQKRRERWPVTYGCCHYTGKYEGFLRNWFYGCWAGTNIASVAANGDICACLDIERRPETVFGNVYRDDFADVWRNGFGIYREGLWKRNHVCAFCPDVSYCRGDSAHSWDFDENRPRVCLQGRV